MSKKYINDDYILKTYEENTSDIVSYQASSSVSQSVTTEQQQVTVRDGHIYIDSTGSYQILYGNSSLHSSFTSPPHTSPAFGFGTIVSGGVAVVGRNINTTVVSRNNNYAGVVVLASGSSGWYGAQELVVSSTAAPIGTNGEGWMRGVGANFDFDRKEGKHIIICSQDASKINYGKPLSGKVFIYQTASTGFYLSQTITTASLPNSIKNFFAEDSNQGSADYYSAGYQGWASSARIDGDYISIGSLKHRRHSTASWDMPQYTANSTDDSQGVVIYKSSSTGFVYETFLDGYDNNNNGSNNYAIDSNMSHDFRGGRCIFAGDGGYGAGSTWQALGRIRSWRSGSEGWVNEGAIDLRSLGLTASIGSTYPGKDVGGTGMPTPHDGEFKLYKNFGRNSCVTSGSYIVASAKGETVNSKEVANRIFIIHSKSSGWELEADFKSPNPDTEDLDSTAYNDEFGNGISLEEGRITVLAPTYRHDSGSGTQTSGRAHIYKSSSNSGWALEQTIDNPYSGSTTVGWGSFTGRTEFLWPNSALNGNYPYFSCPADADGHLFLPWHQLTKNNSNQIAYGSVYLLEGSASYAQETQDVEVTQSVAVTEYVLASSSAVPFIKQARGPMNIKLQSGSSSPYSSAQGDSKNPG